MRLLFIVCDVNPVEMRATRILLAPFASHGLHHLTFFPLCPPSPAVRQETILTLVLAGFDRIRLYIYTAAAL